MRALGSWNRRLGLLALVCLLAVPVLGLAQDEVPPAAVKYGITNDKIAAVRIEEESPGRFIAVIEPTAAEKKKLAELTAAKVGESIEVTIAEEPVLRTTIRGPMEVIHIGPWMNKGLANLFARCLEKCGPKNCL
jgi:hypothetical protein